MIKISFSPACLLLVLGNKTDGRKPQSRRVGAFVYVSALNDLSCNTFLRRHSRSTCGPRCAGAHTASSSSSSRGPFTQHMLQLKFEPFERWRCRPPNTILYHWWIRVSRLYGDVCNMFAERAAHYFVYDVRVFQF